MTCSKGSGIHTGVLLVNLGTPASFHQKDVSAYLKQFLLDPRVIDFPFFLRQLLVRALIIPLRLKKVSKTYAKIWTNEGSPLMMHSKNLRAALEKELPDSHVVALAMRYQSPSIEQGLQELRKYDLKQIVILPLFPQYASATNGSIIEEAMRIVHKWQTIPNIQVISSFAQDPTFIDSIVEVSKGYDLDAYDHILISFHGLPTRQLHKANRHNSCLKNPNCCENLNSQNFFCYRAQCFHVAKALVEKLKIPSFRYTICFQSRLGKESWIKPYASDVIKNLAKDGIKKILVLSPSFVCDCLETIYEIGTEYKELFIQEGGKTMNLVESLNSHPFWVQTLKNIILERVNR